MLGRFTWWMEVPESDVPEVALFLLVPDEHAPNGSSFVVDANAPTGYRRIWLSEVSHKRLEENW